MASEDQLEPLRNGAATAAILVLIIVAITAAISWIPGLADLFIIKPAPSSLVQSPTQVTEVPQPTALATDNNSILSTSSQELPWGAVAAGVGTGGILTVAGIFFLPRLRGRHISFEKVKRAKHLPVGLEKPKSTPTVNLDTDGELIFPDEAPTN
jgi:hypothetical protein